MSAYSLTSWEKMVVVGFSCVAFAGVRRKIIWGMPTDLSQQHVGFGIPHTHPSPGESGLRTTYPLESPLSVPSSNQLRPYESRKVTTLFCEVASSSKSKPTLQWSRYPS